MNVYQTPRVTLKNETWEVDETLRKRAEVLVNEYTDQIGHVDLRHIVFVAVEGKNTTWMGKCFKIQPPHNLLPLYSVALLNIDPNVAKDLDDYLSVDYIIALNRDIISLVPQNKDKVIDIVILHELMHVDFEMHKLVKHDSEDFSWILKEFGVDWTKGDLKKDPIAGLGERVLPHVRRPEPVNDFIEEEYVNPETGKVFNLPPLPSNVK